MVITGAHAMAPASVLGTEPVPVSLHQVKNRALPARVNGDHCNYGSSPVVHPHTGFGPWHTKVLGGIVAGGLHGSANRMAHRAITRSPGCTGGRVGRVGRQDIFWGLQTFSGLAALRPQPWQ